MFVGFYTSNHTNGHDDIGCKSEQKYLATTTNPPEERPIFFMILVSSYISLPY